MCFNFFKYIVKFNESHLFEWSKHRDALILPVFALVEKNLVSVFFFFQSAFVMRTVIYCTCSGACINAALA